MLSLTKTTAHRALLAAVTFAAVLLFVAPASADHRRYGRRYYGGHPKVAVVIGLPPIVIGAARPVYDDRDYRPSRYERGYEEGYEDGYDDRAYQEWRRRQHYRRHHHHHDNCDY
ncbi:MAG TPA: hypothetical protein VFT98_09980 [Myxococcota bacterium]|nr:hypothetical protein [Myxococcota bacterium]